MKRTELDGGRGWLDGPAAASIHRMDRQLGHLVQITEAGRTRDRQLYLRNGYLRGLPGFAFALPPDPPEGPSIHQLGNATDSDEDGAPWEENGWIQTALARGEKWHREYDITLDRHINDPDQEDDMPDMGEIFNNKVTTVQGTRQVSLAEAIQAVFYYGDKLYQLINSLPDNVWGHGLVHPLLSDAEGNPVKIMAGDFLRYEPAEHANTRAAVAAVAVGDVDVAKLAADIAARYPQIDVHALAVAAADEADRRDRERLALTAENDRLT